MYFTHTAHLLFSSHISNAQQLYVPSGCHNRQHIPEPNKLLTVCISGILEVSDVVEGQIWQHSSKPQRDLISHSTNPISRQVFGGHLQTLPSLGEQLCPFPASCSPKPIRALGFGNLLLPCSSTVRSMSPFKHLLMLVLSSVVPWPAVTRVMCFMCPSSQNKLHSVSGMVIKRLYIKTRIVTSACVWMRFLSPLYGNKVEIECY